MEQLSFDYLLTEEKYYTVSELTREIKILLETRIPEVWVEGEISNFTHHSSGHMYFLLKDEHAQISCVMWRSRNNTLFFTPQDGMKIIVRGRITVYEKRGNYQLEVLQLHPAGVGELQLAFEQLKNRLRKEGLFDPAHKKPIPPYPERIGIVTSPTGAAIRDMIHILQRRFPPVEIILNPVRVQGEGAAVEIAQAIDQFNRYGQVDVLIVGRGGGSLEDLWAFNEEIVARAIFRSQIPVISAVGHEVDFSISDFVADLRAPTPSAAAELVVRNREEILAHLQKDLQKMTNGMLELIRTHRKRLQHIASGYA
ncbi:MAG: exodeoxyribonuclease VII large subunit, partial [Calditrichaeota bacterium]